MTYPQDTQLSFHLGWMIIFSTLIDCSGPSSLFMSCSARTTRYVWNLDWEKIHVFWKHQGKFFQFYNLEPEVWFNNNKEPQVIDF